MAEFGMFTPYPEAQKGLKKAVSEKAARRLLRAVKHHTPVRTGYAQRSWRISTDDVGPGRDPSPAEPAGAFDLATSPQYGVWVYSIDPFMHLIEWGSINNIAYAPMRKAIAEVGAQHL